MVRVAAEHLGKRFRRHVWRSARRWRDVLRAPWRRSSAEEFWALRDVSFELDDGEMLGVVGHNGAGKSTLLNLLGGIGEPSEGRVRVSGRIGALLDLGGGFVGDLTGRENAELAGVVAGLTRPEIRARLPEIVSFAGIEAFLDAPVRTYSTGMAARLAFSVAVHTEPAVLLVDEFLSVGDLAFQAKCRARIRALRDAGCAVVFVSHSVDDVRKASDRVLWLSQGRVVALGAPDVVAARYETEMTEETVRRMPSNVAPVRVASGRTLTPNENRFGSFEATITRVTTRPAEAIRTGDPLEVEIDYHSEQRVIGAVFVVSITRQDGAVCLDTNTQTGRVAMPDLHGDGRITLRIERLDLGDGTYCVNVGLFEARWTHAYDYHGEVYPLTVDGPSAQKGVLAPPCQWTIDEHTTMPDRDQDSVIGRRPRGARSGD
jgi:lipopolysaccharide transport system ATP-binding protein